MLAIFRCRHGFAPTICSTCRPRIAATSRRAPAIDLGDLEPIYANHATERTVYFVAALVVVIMSAFFGLLGYSLGRLDAGPQVLDCITVGAAHH